MTNVEFYQILLLLILVPVFTKTVPILITQIKELYYDIKPQVEEFDVWLEFAKMKILEAKSLGVYSIANPFDECESIPSNERLPSLLNAIKIVCNCEGHIITNTEPLHHMTLYWN